MRYDLGQKVLYLVALNIVINFIVLIAILVKKIYRGIRSWYVKRYNRIVNEKAIIRRAIKASKELPVRKRSRRPAIAELMAK